MHPVSSSRQMWARKAVTLLALLAVACRRASANAASPAVLHMRIPPFSNSSLHMDWKEIEDRHPEVSFHMAPDSEAYPQARARADQLTAAGASSVTFVLSLRNPFKHVLAQFLHCKFWRPERHGKRVKWFTDGRDPSDILDGLEDWVDYHLSREEGAKGRKRSRHLSDQNCYNPWNMQTRYLSPSPHLRKTKNGGKVAVIAPRHAFDFKDLHPQLSEAMLNLEKVDLVTVAELYGTSVCMLEYEVSGELPDRCSCDSSDQPVQAQYDVPGVPAGSVDNVPVRVLKKMYKLIENDVQLYLRGLTILETMVHDAESKTGKRLICDADSTRVWDEVAETRNKLLSEVMGLQ
mmetsp:Transcript_9650/g.27606  ORF Transcript_9650/g.27606 Transcript_9650/m.27606 type:complete len:348 (+) Transcript_9650:88-1131(+)